MSHDAIVIGAGVNGLVAAQYLARAGRRVLVLERAAEADGSADVGWIPRTIVRELALARHGLKVQRPDPWIVSAMSGARPLELFADVEKSVESIKKLSAPDAARWPEFCVRVHRLARVLERLYQGPPPDLDAGAGELLSLARLGLGVKLRGREAVIDLLRTLPMSIGQVLDEWFETPALKGAIAGPGVGHLCLGPRSGGTAFAFAHHHVGAPPGVFRAPASNLGAVLAGLPGVEIRRNAEVAQVVVRDGRATGVVLARGGDEIAAPLVVSSADPRRTMLGMVDAAWLDPEFVRAVRHVKYRGVVARVTLAIDRDPGFGALAVAPSVDYLERAYDDAKYGRVSRQPCIEARREDGAIVAHVQYVPYAPADGPWDDARRRALGDLTARTLAEHAAGLGVLPVLEVLTPADLEARYGATEGHLYHGEISLDQILFMRPVPGWSRYRTPIEGLYLCGPGTHPGGGVLGASGRNAARAIHRET